MLRVTRTRFAVPTLALALGLFPLCSAGPAAAAPHHAPESRHSPEQHHAPGSRHAPESRHARDVAATRVYVEANYRLVRAARADLAASQAAIRALARDTVAACPLAGEGSYANNAANQVSEEVIATIVTTAYHPDVAAIHAFVGAVARLRWSNQRLTRIVHGYLVKLENLAVLPPANICEDTKAFAALDFRTAPAATLSYDKLYLAADIEAEEVPLRLFAPYEGAPQAALLRRTKQLETPLAEAEAHAVSEWTSIMRGLALSE